jgi:transposase
LDEKFDESHRARVVEKAVNRLDLDQLRQIYMGVGSPANPPELMLKMVLFEYLEGRTSPAQWCRDATVHDALKWLGRGLQPSRSAWYAFRDRMDKGIEALNDDQIRQAVQEGLAAPVEAAQDGTTFRSQASRHRAVNQETLENRRAKVDAAIAADEHQMPPPAPPPSWMPATPRGRLDLQRRMERARQRLRAELQENRQKPKDRRRLDKNIVVSLTDPDAIFARDKEKTFCFLYTAQFMVDSTSLLVLGYSVSADNTDVGTLPPMIDKVQSLIGGTLRRVNVDAGYTSLLDLIDYHDRNIDVLGPVQSNSFTGKKQQAKSTQQINKADFLWLDDEQTFQCPEGHKLFWESRERIDRHAGRHVTCNRYRCPPEFCCGCLQNDRCTKNPTRGRTVRRLEREELIDAQKAKMQCADNKAAYRTRGQTIERPFADAKGHRNFGKLHGRELSRARAEVGLLVLAQNMLTLERLRKIAPCPQEQTT